MVEQEHSQASPAFPYSQDSSARPENEFHNPWFMIDSTTLLKEKPLCSSNADVEENYSNMMQDHFVEEHNESYLKKYSKAVTKVEEWSQPMSEMFPATYDPYFEVNSPLSFWGACPLDLDTMKIDDVFQVDKDDLVQSPTLAELNANDESLFDSFDCFDDFIPNGNKGVNKQLMQDLNPDFNIAFNNADNPKNISCSASSVSMKEEVFPQNESSKKQASKTLNKQLFVQDLNQDFNVEFNNADNPKNTSCSSSSTTIEEQVFPEKNESLKKHSSPHSTKEIVIKPKLQTSLHDKLHSVPASTDDSKRMKKINKPQLNTDCDNKDSALAKASVEEVYLAPCTSNNPETAPDTEDDSEMDCDFSSDADNDSEDETRLFSLKRSIVNKGSQEKKGPRYFWQYNIQSKGPKGPTMKLSEKCSNAHDVKGVADPIFSPDCPIDGVKHSGKARRGDGNDLTPNPKKLYSIGKELEKLNNLIDGLVPVNELPVNARTKSRKEKNKLASRVCRLKKKAQHEANKLKLYGLQEEQKHLLMLTKEVKKLVKARVLQFKQNKSVSILATIESLQKKKAITKVAGCSAEFVNNVLKYVASGDESGGLNVTPVHEN